MRLDVLQKYFLAAIWRVEMELVMIVVYVCVVRNVHSLVDMEFSLYIACVALVHICESG